MKIKKLLHKSMFTWQAHVTPNWVLNGHWAVKYRECGYEGALTRDDLLRLYPSVAKDIAETRFDHHCTERQTDAIVLDNMPPGDLAAWHRTPWLKQTGLDWLGPTGLDNRLGRIYISDDQTRIVMIDDAYAAAAGLETVYGIDDRHTFINAATPELATFMVMPIRSDGLAFPVMAPAVEAAPEGQR